MLKLQNQSGRLARWSPALSQYEFKILWRKGEQNDVANGLSRSPLNSVFATLIRASELLQEVTPEYPQLSISMGSPLTNFHTVLFVAAS